MRHVGMLLTKNDDLVIGEWFDENILFFDALYCLDGSCGDRTRDVATSYPQTHYWHEQDVVIAHKTDHGLRAFLHREIFRREAPGAWITLCHADEFFYHDPRRCCLRADAEGYDGLWWYSLHFLPHPDDLEDIDSILDRPVSRRFLHYHWDHDGSGEPWREFRSYKCLPKTYWHAPQHGSTQPYGCDQVAPFLPVYRHLKVYDLSIDRYSSTDQRTLFRDRWRHVRDGRSGLPWTVQSDRDLFVARYPPYRQCGVFSGRFNEPWNMGDDFRGPPRKAREGQV